MEATRPCSVCKSANVQLPYRYPVTAETHCLACPHDCTHTTDESELIESAQVAQDAQAGYACDYCNKRQPMAFNEVKECCKGHQDLTERVGDRSVNYIGKRHHVRMMSDAYGKGIVRGQVENTNLRAHAKPNDVTFAESIRTCQTECFFG